MEWVLVAGAVVAGAAYVRGRRQRATQRRLEAADLSVLRQTLDEDVVALGEDLQQLDADLIGEELDDGSRLEFKRGLDAYDRAKDAADRLGSAADARQVTERLDDGRFAIACVQARVAGRPKPERRAPCFFDPRHGPSTTDVRWAPSGGTMREVPACALDAERVRGGVQPHARKVLVGTRLVPYWRAGPAFRPLAAGYFGADSALLLFAGTAIGTEVAIAQGGPARATPAASPVGAAAGWVATPPAGAATSAAGRLTWPCGRLGNMCRNIRTLSHFEPPASAEEVQAAARQYVRKVSGTTSAANQEAVDRAVAEVTAATRELLDSLVFTMAPRDRDTEAAKARERSARRFASDPVSA